MDDFLTPVSTIQVKRTQNAKPLVQEIRSTVDNTNSTTIDSPDKALEILKEQPDFEAVSKTLEYLTAESEREHGFHLMLPDPVAANIVYQLINTTIPDYWQTLKDRGVQLKQLVRCLRNPCGVGNIITRLRPLIVDCRQKKPVGHTRDAASHIEDLLEFVEKTLHGDQCLSQVWNDIEKHGKNAAQRKLMWKEFVTQVASGRIISLVAEAEDVLKEKRSSRSASWIADGRAYASWLGCNIASLMRGVQSNEESATAVVDVCSKALTLGYLDQLVSSMLSILIDADSIAVFTSLLHEMKVFEQRKYLNAILTFLSNRYLSTTIVKKGNSPPASSPRIAGAAALIHELVKSSEPLKEHLVTSLTKSSLPALDDWVATRRSVIAALAQDEDNLHTLLENTLKLFGDSFYTKHTPILQQEALAQTLAVSCGYVQRSQPMFLTMMAKSSYHVSGMSNRIGSPSPRARFLGIAVGMAISKLVDTPETQLKFELEGDEAEEAQWYQHLTQVDDALGSIADLKTPEKLPSTKQPLRKPKPAPLSKRAPKPPTTDLTGPRIVEILSSSEDDADADLTPYPKPDSDPEDDTDDPTEISRTKPTAPVYIRDLIAGLRSTDDYDRHALALSTAAPLIRRKAHFGTEVRDHVEELAGVLVGLDDQYELEGFAEKKQDALIAVLVAEPGGMAQWFARAFFGGDYSLSQRTFILTTLGLGARELAGLKDETSSPSSSFPSKALPAHLHALYTPTPSSSPVDRLTSTMAHDMLAPLAASAASTLSGPAILNVSSTRTFSTRMEVEARRSKPQPNALSQLVASSFFFPLTGRFFLALRSGEGSVYTSTHLLPPFLQTLALLLHATGPSTPALPQMTGEAWALFLAVRGYAQGAKPVLAALLFALLVLVEVNEDKAGLAAGYGKELLETLEWARGVFASLPGGEEGGEDERVRMLAAGVVVRCQEVVDAYQRRLVGSMMDY